ncbi:MAG: hypothetical protein KGO81_08325 [Bacteroidota bacterium]|nr:hypothetical protein [Bacteroidota bacterium]
MKKVLLAVFMIVACNSLFAQAKNPVSWTYRAVKKGSGMYELVMTATVEKPWHIYSQNTGSGGPVPTNFTFRTNPLLVFQGKAKETGKLVKVYDNNFKTNVLYYSDKVVFTQTVKLKGNAKTNVSGTVEYMVCDDEQCLPPTKKSFDISLQ